MSDNGDPMDVSQPPTVNMGPPSTSESRASEPPQVIPEEAAETSGSQVHPVGAAAAAQQPKIVQTAFIHKLYKYVFDSSKESSRC